MSLTYFERNIGGSEQLWVSDGTVAGTHLVKAFGSGISELMTIGANAYFTFDDGTHGNELWTSDGTIAGTGLVADIAPGSSSSALLDLVNVNGTLFFRASDGMHGAELWKSDGTAAGTVMVKDIKSGTSGSTPSHLVDVNGTLFFDADDGTDGFELWKSDGTAAGTVLVKDIVPGTGSSDPHELTNVAGTLFFQATDSASGDELWRSDGTSAGTMLVKDILPGAGGSFPSTLTDVNGTLFFSAETSGPGDRELWKSDGTAAGTVLVKDIDPGSGSGDPVFLTNVNGTVFFEADDGVHGFELWKSDGTAAGTVMVKDINPGSTDGLPQILTNVSGTLFFVANDGAHGRELWKSDGTVTGTVMVKDINAGIDDSNPDSLTNVNGVLEFYAFDGQSEGLFRSDGTAGGTIELATNVDTLNAIGFSPTPLPSDFNGDRASDVLWRNTNGALAGWGLSGSVISSSGFLTSGGIVARPDASWSVAGISDFNGDGRADVLWRNLDGTLADWTMSGSTIALSGVLNLGGVAVRPDASWSVAGVGDFDGDSHSDILWRNSNGTLANWSMNGSTIVSSGFVTAGGVPVNPSPSWSVAGIGDLDGDGRSDILWRNTSGEVVAWLMNGSAIAGSGDVTFSGVAARPDATWSIAGVGDFNHEGKSDLLWRNANGSLAMWLMNGTTIASSSTVTFNGAAVAPDASWHVVEIGDFNGDGRKDILWRNASGEVTAWLMNGTAITGSADLTAGGIAARPDVSWSVAGVGDFNHDGRADILWRNSSGALAEWLMSGTTITGSGAITSGGVAVAPDATWHVVEIGDFNADGNSDILWRNNNGALAEWLMNGNAISQSLTPTSNGAMVTPDASWSTQAKPTIS